MLTIPRIDGAVTELMDRSATSWAAHRELAGGRGCPPAWASRWGVSRCRNQSGGGGGGFSTTSSFCFCFCSSSVFFFFLPI